MQPKIMTANRLDDGAVVYLAEAGVWVEDLEAALVVEDETGAESLERQAAEAQRHRLVVGPYLFPVALEAGRPLPLGQRERIRAAGPSVPLPQLLEI